MVIEIMGRKELLTYSFSKNNEKTAVISISNRDEDQLSLHNDPDNGIEAICYVSFDDVEIGKVNCITDDDAKRISSFVYEVISKKDKLIVQCGAGISRSAGVAAAILKHFSDNDMLIWGNFRYYPNILCYRKVLAAFNGVIDEQELREKITANRNICFSTEGESNPRMVLLNEVKDEITTFL